MHHHRSHGTKRATAADRVFCSCVHSRICGDVALKRILIIATPRTGSNLLLDSLATHPEAVTGGEWLAPEPLKFNSLDAIRNLSTGVDCNLFKVFASQLYDARFRHLLSRCECVVYLYRKDIDAQVRSWMRACDTGIWVNEQPWPNPCDQPLKPKEHIFSARIEAMSIATISICYETMVTKWDATISYILACAEWANVTLQQAHAPMSDASTTQCDPYEGNSQDDK